VHDDDDDVGILKKSAGARARQLCSRLFRARALSVVKKNKPQKGPRRRWKKTKNEREKN
jgi:hypothetical protein